MSHTAHHLHSSYGLSHLPIHTHTHTHKQTHTHEQKNTCPYLLPPLISHFQSLWSPCNRFCQRASTSASPWQQSWNHCNYFNKDKNTTTTWRKDRERERGHCVRMCMLCLWPFDKLVFIDSFLYHMGFCWCLCPVHNIRGHEMMFRCVSCPHMVKNVFGFLRSHSHECICGGVDQSW